MSDDLTLCVTVRFLTSTYHGRDGDGEPEWPPSPLRLYQALVATAGSRRTDAERDALRWLEGKPAPAVIAHEKRATGRQRAHYVPNNDADRHTDRAASRVEKVFRPLHLPDRAEAQYRWPITPADQPHAEVIARLAGRLRCLGWGIDTVAGRGGFNCGEPDGAKRWAADDPGTSGLPRRVTKAGTLDSLDATHQAKISRFQDGGYRPSDANITTRPAVYRPDGGLPARPWLAFSLVMLADGSRASFWPVKVAEVAGQVRHAAKLAGERCGWDDDVIRSYVCGHDVDGGKRLSFLPLPSVGHPFSDAMIRRVLIVAPPGDEARLRELRSRLVGPLQPKDSEPTVAMVPCPFGDKVVQRYTGASHTWSTVTPAILPGHISRGSLSGEPFELTAADLAGGASTSVGKKAAKVVVQMLDHAGVPIRLVKCLTFTGVPLLPNLPHAMRFRPPSNLERYQRAHIRLVLAESVPGPLSLGLGRFRGLGLLVAT